MLIHVCVPASQMQGPGEKDDSCLQSGPPAPISTVHVLNQWIEDALLSSALSLSLFLFLCVGLCVCFYNDFSVSLSNEKFFFFSGNDIRKMVECRIKFIP